MTFCKLCQCLIVHDHIMLSACLKRVIFWVCVQDSSDRRLLDKFVSLLERDPCNENVIAYYKFDRSYRDVCFGNNGFGAKQDYFEDLLYKYGISDRAANYLKDINNAMRLVKTRGVSLEKISYTFTEISNKNLIEKSKNLIKIPKICEQF